MKPDEGEMQGDVNTQSWTVALIFEDFGPFNADAEKHLIKLDNYSCEY